MKEFTKYRLREAVSITLVMALIYICTHLFYEIITVDQFRGIGFSNGYITISGKPIGHHIISYISAMVIGFLVIFYSTKE